jgi:hypothetical protein
MDNLERYFRIKDIEILPDSRIEIKTGVWLVSDLRIKFYAKWKEFIKEQAVDPDQPR